MESQAERRRENERIAVLETEIRGIKKQLDEMTAELRIISSALSEAKGGWRVMMMVGGAAGMLGALLSKWMSSLTWILPK